MAANFDDSRNDPRYDDYKKPLGIVQRRIHEIFYELKVLREQGMPDPTMGNVIKRQNIVVQNSQENVSEEDDEKEEDKLMDVNAQRGNGQDAVSKRVEQARQNMEKAKNIVDPNKGQNNVDRIVRQRGMDRDDER